MSSLIGWLNKLINYKGEHKSGRPLIFIVGAIVIFGLIMLSSASSVIAYSIYHDSYYFFKHQIFGLVLGLLAFWFFSKVDYQIWRKYAWAMLVGSVILLLLVFVPGLGKLVNGSRSWIDIFGFSLQPAEFVKLTFLIYLSAWFAGKNDKLIDIKQRSGQFWFIMAAISILMLMQPDFGTLFIIGLISLSVYFVSGHQIKYVVVGFFVCLIGLFFLLSLDEAAIKSNRLNHQLDRFRCVINSNFDKQGACYQVNQSLIAIGSGGIFGRGLGDSRQKFFYIPEVQNDFIFSIIGEEVGFIFGSLLVVFYFILFYFGCRVAKNTPDDFGKMLALGIVVWMSGQAILNIGGIINLLPMTGVPLPLISSGGSAMLAGLASIGILVNISKQTEEN